MTIERAHGQISDLRETIANKRAGAALAIGMTALGTAIIAGNIASSGDVVTLVIAAAGTVMSATGGTVKALEANELGQKAAALQGAVTLFELQASAESEQPYLYPEGGVPVA